MRRQIRGLNQASDNTQDGISFCQVADGALNEVSDMLHRIAELSVKAANGTNTAQDREYIQEEVDELLKEIDRISNTTTFNEQKIFLDDSVKDTPQYRLQESFRASITADTAKGGNYQLNVSENDGIKLMLEGNNGLTQEAVFDWSEIKNKVDQTKTLADTDMLIGTYEFEKNGICFSFEVSEGSSKEEIVEALNGAEFTLKNGISTFQPVQVKSCSVEVASGVDIFFTNMSSYKIVADEDGICMTDKNGNTTSKVTWASMGVNKDVIGGSSFTYACPDTGYTVTFSIASDASFQEVLDSLNGNNTKISRDILRGQLQGGGSNLWSGSSSLWRSVTEMTVTRDTIDQYLTAADKQHVSASFRIIEDTGVTANTTAKAQITLKGYTGTMETIMLEPDSTTEALLSQLKSGGLTAGTVYTLSFSDSKNNKLR